MISLILACFLFLSMSTQLASYEQICPLSRYNIKVAEDLMKTTQELIEEAGKQGLDTSEAEQVLTEAMIILERALE